MMRKLFTIAVLLLTAHFLTASPSVNQTNSNPGEREIVEETFIVLGNCYLCLLRIEGAAEALPGVQSSTWSSSEEKCTVVFDNEITDLGAIMQAIAAVGHDTEWYPAPDEAYKELIGTCCEYDRWLVYTGIGESNKLSFSIYPVPATSILNVDIQSEINDELSYQLISIDGKVVREDILSTNYSIDISALGKGNYLIALYKNNQLVGKQKFVK